VPTVIVSPYIPRGKVDDTPYDHTSVIATLNQLFGPFRPLSRRDAQARSFHHLLGLSAARPAPELPPPLEPGPSLGEEPSEHVPPAAVPVGLPDRPAQQDETLSTSC
jgi:Phosphoesterase family